MISGAFGAVGRGSGKAGWFGDATALDSNYVRALRAAHGGRGRPREQAIGPSRAVPTTKIHVLTKAIGRPSVIGTPGEAMPLGRFHPSHLKNSRNSLRA